MEILTASFVSNNRAQGGKMKVVELLLLIVASIVYPFTSVPVCIQIQGYLFGYFMKDQSFYLELSDCEKNAATRQMCHMKCCTSLDLLCA